MGPWFQRASICHSGEGRAEQLRSWQYEHVEDTVTTDQEAESNSNQWLSITFKVLPVVSPLINMLCLKYRQRCLCLSTVSTFIE